MGHYFFGIQYYIKRVTTSWTYSIASNYIKWVTTSWTYSWKVDLIFCLESEMAWKVSQAASQTRFNFLEDLFVPGTTCFIYYCKYILLITQPSQCRCAQLQCRFAVISEAPSTLLLPCCRSGADS